MTGIRECWSTDEETYNYDTLGELLDCNSELEGQQRLHPAQKPEVLMDWTLDQVKASGTVFDPYMGSGTTGVSCARLGLPFIGIEIDRHYFDIACKRIDAAQRQLRMFA